MINYWKGAKGSKDLLNAFNIEINNLLTSNYALADLEKLQHPSQHVIYSYRLNQADRLLFTTVNGFLYVLEFVPNHDYQKSRFLKSGVLRDYLKKHVEDNEPLFGELSDENDKPEFLTEDQRTDLTAGFDHYNQQFISLSDTQSHYVETSHLPLVLHGAAGSGKTYMGFSMIQEKLQYDAKTETAPRCLYITKEHHLASSMQRNWENSFLPGSEENEGTIEFKTYEKLLSDYGLTNLVSETDFNEWFQTFKSNDGLPFTTASEYYQELRICAALTKNEYEDLGERQSSLPRTDVRTTFYALYQQYVNVLGNKIDPALSNCLDGEDAAFDFIVVDEANCFSLLQNLTLSKLARSHAVVYCLDALQNMEEICSTRNLLEVKLRQFNVSSVTLDKTYRCSKQVSHALDIVLENNRIILGGKVDKAEALSMSVSSEVDEGEFYKFPPSQIIDNPWLNERAKSIHFAVVTHENNFEEARAQFNTELIFTPQQIQGQEFHTVVVYKLLSNAKSKKLLRQSAKALSDTDSSALTHRSKSKISSPNAPWAHKIFTACARAQHTLVVIDEDNLYWQRLSPLPVVSASNNPVAIQSSSKKEWQDMALRQQDLNNSAVAVRIHEKLSLKESLGTIVEIGMPSVTQHYDEKLSSDFFRAIKAGNFKKVKKLIKKPEVNLNQQCSEKMHSITLACHEGNLQIVKLLLEMGERINFNAQVEYALSPLQAAVNFNYLDIVKALLSDPSRIDLNQRNGKGGPTALMLSASRGYTEVAKLIMNQPGCDLDMKDKKGHTALMFASANNKIEIVKDLVLTQCDVNIVDIEGYTALMLAVKENNIDIVEILIKAPSINLNHCKLKNGSTTPLLVAASKGHYEIVRLLISASCNINIKQEGGDTALMVASAKNYVSITQLLINKGCEINTVNDKGLTALMIAANNGYADIVRVIASAVNCDLNKPNYNGDSALMIAVERDKLNVVKELVKYSNRINLEIKAKDKGDFTAFMIAAFIGRLSIAKVLIAAGCNVNVSTPDGDTALMIALSQNNNDIARLLLEKAPDLQVNIFNFDGGSALSYLLGQKPIDRSLLDLILDNPEVMRMALLLVYQIPEQILRDSPILMVVMMKKRKDCWEVLKSPQSLSFNNEKHKVFLKEVLSSSQQEDKYKVLHDILFKPCHQEGFFTSGQNEPALQIKEYIQHYCEINLETEASASSTFLCAR